MGAGGEWELRERNDSRKHSRSYSRELWGRTPLVLGALAVWRHNTKKKVVHKRWFPSKKKLDEAVWRQYTKKKCRFSKHSGMGWVELIKRQQQQQQPRPSRPLSSSTVTNCSPISATAHELRML